MNHAVIRTLIASSIAALVMLVGACGFEQVNPGSRPTVESYPQVSSEYASQAEQVRNLLAPTGNPWSSASDERIDKTAASTCTYLNQSGVSGVDRYEATRKLAAGGTGSSDPTEGIPTASEPQAEELITQIRNVYCATA